MFRCSKPIHLYKDLIQRLFPLIIAHTKFPPIPRFSNRIDFVDKDNRRLMTSCLSEQITYTRCSYTNKHFDKLGPRDRKEGDSSFARRSFCKECFSCSGGARKDCSTRDFGTETFVDLWFFEKLYEFDDFFFCFV